MQTVKVSTMAGSRSGVRESDSFIVAVGAKEKPRNVRGSICSFVGCSLLPTPPVVNQPPLLIPLIRRAVLAGLNERGLAHAVRFAIREGLDQHRQHLVGGGTPVT